MRNTKAAVVLATMISGAVLLGGCSFNKTVDNIKDVTDIEVTEGSAVETKPAGRSVDESLEAPVFVYDMTGSTTVTSGTEIKINCPAEVTDGGEVTYQWYKNNVNSNGGGTEIEGATDAVLNVDTTEAGSVFYYVVAVNNHGDSVNMSASSTYEITVMEKGNWTSDGTGYRYVMEDDSYPVDITIWIDNMMFTINADGYRTDDGRAIEDTTVVLNKAAAATDAAEEAPAEAAPAETDAAAAEQAAAEAEQ